MPSMTLAQYDPLAAVRINSFFAEHEPSVLALLPKIRVVSGGRLVTWLGQGGLTLGFQVQVRDHYSEPPFTSFDRAILLAHECVHVAQYARYGMVGFFARLLWQMLTRISYERTPIEREAEELGYEFEWRMHSVYYNRGSAET